MYAVTTPFENGARRARSARASRSSPRPQTAGLQWLVLASVASAGSVSSVPHFASKWQIEQRLAAGSAAMDGDRTRLLLRERARLDCTAINGGRAADGDPGRQAARAGRAGEPGSARRDRARPAGRAPRSPRRGRRRRSDAAADGGGVSASSTSTCRSTTVANPDVRAMYQFLVRARATRSTRGAARPLSGGRLDQLHRLGFGAHALRAASRSAACAITSGRLQNAKRTSVAPASLSS